MKRTRSGAVLLATMVLAVLSAIPVTAQPQVIAGIPASFPSAVGVNPSTNRIYVSNVLSSVSVIDGATNTVIATIPVGATPIGVAVNPVTNRIYVANGSSNSVSVIDGATNTVVATLSPIIGPRAIGVNPTTNRIYVTNTSGIAVIDGTTNTVIAAVTVVGTLDPLMIGVNPVTNRIYLPVDFLFTCCTAPGSVSVIDSTTNTVIATVSVGLRPSSVAVNPSTNRIYVLNFFSDDVSVIDGTTNTVVATVPVVCSGEFLAVNPSTSRIYVSLCSNAGVAVIEDITAPSAVATTVTVSAPSTQYSDATTLSAAVSPVSSGGQALTGTVQFSLNGSTVGSPVAVNTSGVATLTVPSVLLAAGTYPVAASFTSTNANFANSTGSGTLTVTREDAVVAPLSSNPSAVRVNAPGGTAGPITLTATITEAADDTTHGDTSNAVPVTYTLTPVGSGSPLSCMAPSSAGSVSGGGVGGTLTVSCTFTNVPVNVYVVHIDIGGRFYTGAADSVLAVFDPSLGFTTGGGTILHNGVVANFGITAKYLPSGQIQGNLLYIEHRATGDVMLKSNAMGSLSIVTNSPTSATGILLGKATLNGVGNHSFQVVATDNGEPGTTDTFGLQVKDPSGTVVADLTFSPLTLTGGNIQVPH